MFFHKRRKAFLEAPRIVVRCFDKKISPKARQILGNEDYTPEFIYYSTMGRADLIQFACWNAKHHKPGDQQPSFSDLRAAQIDSGDIPPAM